MKVTHVDDHVTSASISGAQAIDFGISDSPEFFQILSSALYTDQMLAVIRETACNAWDAHLEFGKADTPIDIQLSDEYLIFRDYGPGIAPDKIGPIYGTYGGSTKASNGGVTGGFGLGCKSPFAYVEDFEVTSFHEGKMTIYRMSKSNAEVGGKPSIVPMVSNIPTTESGIQVKIAVKSREDKKRFRELIKRVISNGGILCNLNDEMLETLPFDEAKNGFMITNKKTLETQHRIQVRYGNVIYPLDTEQTYAAEYHQCIQFLDRVTGHNRRWGYSTHNLILQAEANSLSVTPSRESLSNQPHTLAAIKTLLTNFINRKNEKLETECIYYLEDRIDKTFIESSPLVLFSEIGRRIPNYRPIDRLGDGSISSGHLYGYDEGNVAEDTLLTFDQLVKTYTDAKYPEFSGFLERDIKTRAKALILSGFGGTRTTKILRSFLRELGKNKYRVFDRKYPKSDKKRNGWEYSNVVNPWVHQHVFAPLIKGFNEDNGLTIDKLYVYEKGMRGGHRANQVVPVKGYRPKDTLYQQFRFARNLVILSFNKMDIIDGAADNSAMAKYWLGDPDQSLIYVCPRSPAKVQAARDYFKNAGCHVIDLTEDQHENYLREQRAKAARPVVVKKPKASGIPQLSAQVKDGLWSNTYTDSTARITNPEFYVKDGRRNPYTYFDTLSNAEACALIVDLFGEKGGMVNNSNQEQRYIDAGVIHWRPYVFAKILEAYKNSANIHEYVKYDTNRMHSLREYSDPERHKKPWVNAVKADPDLREYFGLVDNRTEYEKKIMQLYKLLEDNGTTYYEPDITKEIKLILSKIPVSKEVKHLYELLDSKTHRLRSILNVGAVELLFNRSPYYDEDYNEVNFDYTLEERTFVRDLLLTIIEGV